MFFREFFGSEIEIRILDKNSLYVIWINMYQRSNFISCKFFVGLSVLILLCHLAMKTTKTDFKSDVL